VKVFRTLRSALRERAAAWVLRRQGMDALPVTLQRRRIYILPTRAGLGFGMVIFTMLLAGLNYTNSIALFLTFLLGGLALVGMHQCHRNLLDLKLVDAATAPAFAGDHAAIALLLANESRMARFRLEMRAGDGERPSIEDVSERVSRRIEVRLSTQKRGLRKVDRINIATTHPFGLFRAWTWVHLPLTITVYPRPQGARPMPMESGRNPGPRLRGGAGEDEWQGLRPFRDGDSPRQVAWKAYARGAPLLVKEYASSGAEIRIFDFHRLEGLDTEARLEQLARWIVDAEARGERYGLVLPKFRINPDHGNEHRHRCLTALAMHGIEDHAGA
jgi:uncharacterized protein (DUF58 family)